MKDWYVAQTKPRMEKTALENLHRQGYEGYLPMMYSGHLRHVEPMFPNYLFINLCDETQDWGPIRSTIGLVGLVRFGYRPARLPSGLVAMLKKQEGQDGVHDPAEALNPGDSVIIKDGIFKYYQAIMEQPTGEGRAMFMINAASSHPVHLELQLCNVEPTG